MWRNEAMREFVEWLAEFDAARASHERPGLFALDLYSLFGSIAWRARPGSRTAFDRAFRHSAICLHPRVCRPGADAIKSYVCGDVPLD